VSLPCWVLCSALPFLPGALPQPTTPGNTAVTSNPFNPKLSSSVSSAPAKGP
jgi:hypothetical protein